ncbi:hypothetical protein ACFL1R_09600 [Candidatus Latescibacterota bacterium]
MFDSHAYISDDHCSFSILKMLSPVLAETHGTHSFAVPRVEKGNTDPYGHRFGCHSEIVAGVLEDALITGITVDRILRRFRSLSVRC